MAVFIASEESVSEAGVGIDGLMAAGKLDALKNGAVLWLDSADSQPCVDYWAYGVRAYRWVGAVA